MTGMEWLAQGAWRGTLILAAAFAAAAGLRRASAAVRHFVWTAAFVALLVLPVAMALTPKWNWMAKTPAAAPVFATSGAVTTVSADSQPQAAPASAVLPLVWIIWMMGCGIVAARFLLGAAGTLQMVRGASGAPHARALVEELRRALGIRRPVRALESSQAPMPLTWGILRPVAVLPVEAREWPAARLYSVLLHELVHVQRHDLLAQVLAQAACCLFWFHPLAWYAARQLRKERERACDDAVLNRGVAAPDYAGHLMDLVRSMSAQRARWANAPAMAEASDLESRVRALLDRGVNRSPLTRRKALAVAVLTCAVVLTLGSVASHAQAGRGALSGVVKDPSGARVPQCTVRAKNLDGSNQETAACDPAGEYGFASIPAGRYAIEVMARGFTLNKAEVVLVAGAAARVDANLEIGKISEAVTVTGRKTPTVAPAAPARTAQRIPIGGNVQASKLIFQPRPDYPAELQQQGISGTVMMRAVISKYGEPLNVEVINTDVHPGLAKAALESVRRWRYQPTLLNGQPVEVITTVDVNFELAQ